MAHLVETMAYAGEVPWHGLGTKVSNDMSTDGMLVASGLDWRVERRKLFTECGKENPWVGLYRSTDDKFLTNVTPDWHEIQNHEAFDFFREWVDIGKMEMHTAGSLKDGKMVWVLAKMKNGGIKIFGNDITEPYFLFSLPHEYGMSIDVRFTMIRVVCNNTITFALSRRGDLSVRWSHRQKFNPEKVKEILGVADELTSEYQRTAEFLGSKQYTQETVKEFVSQIFPKTESKNRKTNNQEMSLPARTVMTCLKYQPGTDFAPNSWWQAYNAVTYAVDHELGRTTDTRLASSWYGPNRNKKLLALNQAIEFAKAA